MEELADDEAPIGSAVVTYDSAGVPVIELVGEIDISNADSLRAMLESVVAAQPALIVFDLGRLTFMDSSGIAFLLRVAAQSGAVHVRHPSAIVRRIIEVTGLTDVLQIEP